MAVKNAAVIGGGMSGLCAAILLADAGGHVTLYERQERIGKKILLTGNGRCNISNENVSVKNYLCSCADELAGLLASFGDLKRAAFFEHIGLAVHAVRGGLYPVSNQASSVLDALRYSLYERSVKIYTGSEVTGIAADRRLIFGNGSKSEAYDYVLIAAGGAAGIYGEEACNGLSIAKQLGHSIVNTHPALCCLRPAVDLKAVAGVRCAARLVLRTTEREYTEEGELQINKDSLSGIPLMQLSRYVEEASKCSIIADFLPWLGEGEAALQERAEQFGTRSWEEYFAGWLNKKLALWLIKEAGLKAASSVNDTPQPGRDRLYALCRGYEFKIMAAGSYREAQLMCGGVPLSELSLSLESKYAPGVYLLGELLDVNGECGGYNLHFAMCCAHAACEEIINVSHR